MTLRGLKGTGYHSLTRAEQAAEAEALSDGAVALAGAAVIALAAVLCIYVSEEYRTYLMSDNTVHIHIHIYTVEAEGNNILLPAAMLHSHCYF